MSPRRRRHRFAAGPVASVRHPWLTIAVAAALVVLALVSLRRTTIAGSLHALLGEDSPASAALGRVVRDYRSPDDLLILATIPSDQAPGVQDTRRLTAFAARLRDAVEASAEAHELCRHISWQADPAVHAFVQETVIPSGLYYLDDTAFQAITRRLTADQIREQFRQNEAVIAAAGPAASALAAATLRDPLRLREFVDDRLTGGAGLSISGEQPDLSPDGRSLLIRVQGARSADDLDFASRLTSTITRLAEAVNTDHLDIRASGGYAIASFTAGRIRADMITSTLSSMALIYAVLLILYRSIVWPLVIGAVAGVGILCGFGVHALFKPDLTPLTAVLGAMLGGLGVDYASHLLSQYQANRSLKMHPRNAAVAAARQIGRPLFTACLTTVFGFITLIGAQVAMLRDFAVLGSLGLLCSVLAVVLLMPAILARLDRRRAVGHSASILSGYASWTARHARAAISLSLLIFFTAAAALAAAPGFLPAFETDRTVMHPKPNPPLETSELIAETFSLGESLLVEVQTPSPEQLLVRCYDAERALRSAASGSVTGILGLSTLLPDPRTTDLRRRDIAKLDAERVVSDFQAAVRDSVFDPRAFEGYAVFLRRLLSPAPAPGFADVFASPPLTELLFPLNTPRDRADRTVLVVRLDHHLRGREDRQRIISALRSALEPIPGATLTGFSVVSYDLEQAARVDLPRFAAISLALVTGWLLLTFRRVVDVLLAMSCVLFAAVSMLGFMVLAGQRLNTISVISLPLLVGVAVDNGVFLVSCYRRSATLAELLHDCRASTQAIVACGATTVMAFGTLYWTSTPAIQSFGLAVMIGVTASLLGALGLLMPALILMKSRCAAVGGGQA